MRYSTYLLDFDGTLVDSMSTFQKLMLRILDENNIDYPDDVIKIITPLGCKGVASYFRTLGTEMEEEQILSLINEYFLEEYKYRIGEKENVINTLKIMKEKGADLNILTASPHIMLDACLKRLGIYDMFTNVWSCDDFGTTKADVNIYKMAAQRLGKPIDEILFVDDNLNADKTAKMSGMKVCGIYDEASADYVDEIKSITDHYVYNFAGLLEL